MQERIVYIRRIERNDKTRLPKDLLIDSKQSIGPSFNQFGTYLKGVTGDEEIAIMPGLVAVSINDPTFATRVDDFWKNITIVVPAGNGTKLNIGLDSKGLPVAPLDYVKYKYCLKHIHVAPEEEGNTHQNAMFYVHDPITVTQKKASELTIRNKAKLKYLELIQDDNRMNDVLSVLTSYRNPLILSSEEKQLILENESSKQPIEFIRVVEDEKLPIKSFIYRCINAGVFKESGTRIIYDDTILGNDLSSTVAYLKSKEGSKVYVQAEGKLNQWAIAK